MRAIAILVLVAGLIAARSAAAQPQPDAKAKSPATKSKPKAKASKPAEQAPTSAAGFGLGSMAAQAAGAAARPAAGDTRQGAADARRLDLTPRHQLETGKAGQAGTGRLGAERSSGMSLGDDGDWRVQAMQVGAMAAAFGALVAICGDGKCMLPGFLGGGQDELGPPPGLEIREQPDLRDPR